MPFTHFNEEGRSRMIDVSGKPETKRKATAQAKVVVNKSTFDLVCAGKTKKGDVLSVAQIAGIMAAKRTNELIPMCHNIPLSGCDMRFELREEELAIYCFATCKTQAPTGVEMEALEAVSTAALTIYDMCKSHQRDIVITSIELLEKEGGASGHFVREAALEATSNEALPHVVAVSISEKKGTKKQVQDEIVLKVGHGIVGDAHAGNWHRQVSLLSLDALNSMRKLLPELSPGDFAENILVDGIDVASLPIGSKLKLGEAELTITQIGKECHKGCEIQQLTGACIMPKQGVFAVVSRGGVVRARDVIEQII